ncbi:MAG: FecR family protein [Prevotella sp.]
MEKNDIKDIERKADLFFRKTTGKATAEELREIGQWLGDNEDRRRFMAQLDDTDFLRQEVEQWHAIDVEGAEERMLQRIALHERRSAWHRNIKWISAVAASLLIVVSATMWYWDYTKVTPPTPNHDEIAAIARVKADDEPTVRVEKATPRTKLVADGEMERYNVDEDFAEALENGRKITTLVDKEYWTTLDDGTIVHLNGSSRLVYPEHFGKGQRDVILDGEAYFLVAQDKSRPFIVHTPNGDIKEYGTKFHVATNADGTGATEVVLIEGSIGVTGAEGKEQMLNPGERALMSSTATSIAATDTTKYIAWHTGCYTFQDTTLGYVMDILSHWYGCEVEYADEAMSRQRLTGNFDRGEDFADIIEALEMVTGLRIERMKDGKIEIK